jgi:hypothetical protein
VSIIIKELAQMTTGGHGWYFHNDNSLKCHALIYVRGMADLVFPEMEHR